MRPVHITYILRNDIKKDFGWTDKLIDKYLTPKKTEPNKHGTLTKLYSLQAVKDTMISKSFRQDFRIAQRRKAGAKRAVETKILNAMDQMMTTEIKIPQMTKEDLYGKAVEWGTIKLEGEKTHSLASESEVVLNALLVEYLIRQAPKSSFDGFNKRLVGKCEVKHFHFLLVLDQIARQYPFLRDECDERSGHNLHLLIDQVIDKLWADEESKS